MRITIAFLSALLLFSSCFSNCNEVKLSKADKTWLKPYVKTDTLFFRGDRGGVDTMILDQENSFLDSYTNCNKFEMGPDIYNSTDARFEIRNGSKYKKDWNLRMWVSVSKDFQNVEAEKCIKAFRLYDFECDFVNEKDSLLKTEYIPCEPCGGKVKTFFFECHDDFSNYSDCKKVKSLNWSKKYGLIRYVKSTGEVFELSK